MCELIVGHTKCGKMYFSLKMLEEFFQYFDYIYLLCPTFYRNSTYIAWKYSNDHDFIPVECEEETFEYFLKAARQESMDSNTLIINDLASSRDIKKQASEITKLAMHGRHEGISTIILTQQYTSIAKSYREQISVAVPASGPVRPSPVRFVVCCSTSGVDEEPRALRNCLLNYLRLFLHFRWL